MDPIPKFIAGPAAVWVIVLGIASLVLVGIGVYWFFSRKAKTRMIAELRKKLDLLSPSDPEYSEVRALYISMVIDAERWSAFHPDIISTNPDGAASHGDHTGGDASGAADGD